MSNAFATNNWAKNHTTIELVRMLRRDFQTIASHEWTPDTLNAIVDASIDACDELTDRIEKMENI